MKFLVPVIALGFFLPVYFALAYGVETHAYLTKETIDYYNSRYSEKISDGLKDFLIDGSRREDDTPRWMNHFYDPVKDRGLTYDPAIDATFVGYWQKSKDWAQDPSNQNKALYKVPAVIASILTAIQQKKIEAISAETNFTWQAALEFWANEDKEKAMFALGHVIHLIQDASVPDHTRNDAHPMDSPYEIYCDRFIAASPDVGLKERIGKISLPEMNSLSDYFYSMAMYSNNHFYSKDTIGMQSGYSSPEPIEFSIKGKSSYGMGKDEQGLYILFVKNAIQGNYMSGSKKDFDISVDTVMSAYWSRLSTKAVLHSAGVINLFFKEAANAVPKPEKKSLFGSILDALRNFLFGDDDDDFVNIQTLSPINLENFSEQGNSNNQNNSNNNNNPPPVSDNKNNKDELEEDENEPIIPPAPPVCAFSAIGAPSRTALINEVAWMGSIANANAEWIEIKNISGKELVIEGWQLLDKDGQIKIVFGFGNEIGKIPANGFLLLERTSDESVPAVKADIIYQGALSNADEALRLFDANCGLIDEATGIPSWPVGDAKERRTMERDLSFSWHTYSGSGTNSIFGTPKAENSIPKKEEPVLPSPLPTTTPSSGSSATVYPKLLITEIQTAGMDSASQEFVEIFNPNDSAVSLSGWYIQKKTAAGSSFSTFAKAELFKDQTLPAKSYFVVAREGSGLNADIFTTNALADNNLLAIKNPSGEIVDEVGWGENSACLNDCAVNPKKGESLTRKLNAGIFQDTGISKDDFVINTCPSPKIETFCQGSKEVFTGSPATNVVISEIMPGLSGMVNQEFVELYNPLSYSINLTGFSLKRRSSVEAETWETLANEEVFAEKIIPAQGFFLVASPEYVNEKNPDAIYSTSYHLANSNDVIALFKNDEELDEVEYGEILFGQSLERNAFSEGECFVPVGQGEFLGNGCKQSGTENLFYARVIPKPQNTSSLPEPREAPETPENFQVTYSPEKLSFSFSWDIPLSVVYGWRIKDENSEEDYHPEVFSSLNLAELTIDEVGRSYDFAIRAEDRDGMPSPPVFYETMEVFGLARNIVFSKESDDYRVHVYYDHHPFIPNVYYASDPSPWKMIVFYENKEAIKTINLDYWGDHPEAVRVIYPCCAGGEPILSSVILPANASFCGTPGGAYNIAFDWNRLSEDNHFAVKIDETSLDPAATSRYLTAAFYDTAGLETMNGTVPFLKLVAIDKTKYGLDLSWRGEAPVLNGDVSTTFELNTSSLNLVWERAKDDDDLDYSLIYEIGLGEDEAFAEANFKETYFSPYQKFVAPGENVFVEIRAKDALGNYSNILRNEWHYLDAQWILLQTNENGFTSQFGYKDGMGTPIFASQGFIAPSDATAFNTAVFKIRSTEGGDNGVLKLSVYEGGESSGAGVFLAEQMLGPIRNLNGTDEIAFVFSSPINLTPGIKYWLVLEVASYPPNDDYNNWHRNYWEAVNHSEAGWWMKLGNLEILPS